VLVFVRDLVTEFPLRGADVIHLASALGSVTWRDWV